MRKRIVFLSVLLCLMQGRSMAQQPGDAVWTNLINPSPGTDSLYSVKVQPDGKVVAAGVSYIGSYSTITIARFDGVVPDDSFGSFGIVTTSLAGAHAAARDMELQQDGKIVIAGNYKTTIHSDLLLARYLPNGSADSSFGLNGIVRMDFGCNSIDGKALVIQPDGKIVAAGRCGSFLAVCRVNTDGSPDSTFDSDGMLTTMAAGGATCMELQANGKIVLCCGNAVVRLHPDGSPDNSFGTNGVATLTQNFQAMAIQNDGKMLLAGGGQFALVRLDTAGAPDAGFGNGGMVITTGFITNTSNPGQCATWVCPQPDGRILAGGWAKYGILGNYRDFALARYQSNGAPDSSFGLKGKVTTYISGFTSMSYTAAISHNYLVAGGVSGEDAGTVDKWAMACYYLGPMLGVPTPPEIDAQILVAPNPAEDFASIQSAHIKNGTWRLSLCDLAGKTLYSDKVVVTNNTLDKGISLTGLPAAMYLVLLDNGSSRMTVKLLKRR